MSALLLGSVLLPTVLALVTLAPRGRGLVVRLAPWSAAPALLLALLAPAGTVLHLPWLLLGSSWGIDETGRIFLFFTAALWLAAGVQARTYLRDDPRRTRYFLFHLLALTGNLGLIVSLDVVGFYLFFALMSFAAYGLVVHAGDEEARRAGRVYLAMAVLGETCLLGGILLAAGAAEGTLLTEVAGGVSASPHSSVIVGLLLAGFGIKAGALPLHVWLPLAHPVAPTPASAVLSGSMIKAGLLGWLRLLPLGSMASPEWGALVVGLGLTASLFGVIVGVTQSNPKTALAYSSISQIGLINIGVGLALMDGDPGALAVPALLVYAAHHGLAKGALFLGVAVAQEAHERWARGVIRVGMLFAALAVAGAPLTSGSVAKGAISGVAYHAPGGWPVTLDWFLPLSSVGTTLLMAHFLGLIWNAGKPEARVRPGVWIPWLGLLVLLALVLRLLTRWYRLELAGGEAHGWGYLLAGLWPIALGATLWWLARLFAAWRGMDWRGREIPAGDLLVLVEEHAARLGRWVTRGEGSPRRGRVERFASGWYALYARSGRDDRVWRMEVGLTRWGTTLTLMLLLVLFLVALLAWGGNG